MSEIDTWRAYARALGFPYPEEAEKDYIQELLLQGLYSRIGDELVLGGGTAISKAYKSGRFSDDLDFIEKENVHGIEKKVESAIEDLGRRFNVDYKAEGYKNMVEFTVLVEGPLYISSGNPAARQRVGIDLNTYERPLLGQKAMLLAPIYADMRPYTIVVEAPEELLADKIKAAIERRAKRKTIFVRDLYDAWFLIRKYGLKPNLEVVRKKMELYGIKQFEIKDFVEGVEEAGAYWKKELERVLAVVPDYKTAREELLESIGREADE